MGFDNRKLIYMWNELNIAKLLTNAKINTYLHQADLHYTHG